MDGFADTHHYNWWIINQNNGILTLGQKLFQSILKWNQNEFDQSISAIDRRWELDLSRSFNFRPGLKYLMSISCSTLFCSSNINEFKINVLEFFDLGDAPFYPVKNVVFDRCVFSECAFVRDKDIDPPLEVQFRHCTFMDMDAALKNIPAENLSNSISEIVT